MAMYDALHGCQSDARALKLVGPVQALKNSEQLVHILHIKPDAVVFDEYHGAIGPMIAGSNLNFWRRPRARKLDGIRNKVQ